MPASSAFSLEEKYQVLEQQLILFTTDRLNLYRLVQFFNDPSAGTHPENFRSYFLETAEWFEMLFNPATLRYHAPEFYRDLTHILQVAIAAISEGPIADLYQTLIHTCRLHAAVTYFYLGEFSRGLHLLNGEENKLQEDIHTVEGSGYHRFNRWRKLLKTNYRNLDPKLWESLDQIDSEWKQVTTWRQDRIWTMLISQDLDISGMLSAENSVQLGSLQPLTVTTELLPDQASEDIVIFHNKTSSYNDLAFQQSWDAVRGAKRMYPRRGIQSKKRLKIIYSFSDTASLYTGDSMGFAMGLVTVANLSRILESLREYRLPQNVIVTGAMDQHGELKPVSPESLSIKMTSVLYSPFETVGIPAKNLGEARKLINLFSKRYPNRHLEIVSVKSLREALHHPRLVIKKAVPFSQQLKIFSRNWGAIAALTVLTVLGLIFLPTWDINPAHVQVTKNNIEVSNRKNRPLWTYPIDTSFWPPIYNKDSALLRLSKNCLVTDLDRDGKYEVVVPSLTVENGYVTGQVMYFESDGRLKWTYPIAPKLQFGETWFSPTYYMAKIRVLTPVNSGETPDILVVAGHSTWYPTLIIRLDTKGRFHGQYIHSGHFFDVTFLESGDPSGAKLLFYGTNNDYNRGVIGIFDPDHLDGHSPQDQFEYTPQGVEVADHDLYMRFPQLNDILPFRARSNITSVVKKNPTEYWVDLQIGTWGRVMYTLDTNFQYRDVDFADVLLSNYRVAFTRDIFEDYTLDELKYRLSGIEYWENGKWVIHRGILDSLTYSRP